MQRVARVVTLRRTVQAAAIDADASSAYTRSALLAVLPMCASALCSFTAVARILRRILRTSPCAKLCLRFSSFAGEVDVTRLGVLVSRVGKFSCSRICASNPEACLIILTTETGDMVLVLCIGDLHIPHRATDLPPKFKQLLVPGKIHYSLCPGNLCTKEIHDYLKTVCADLHVTKGDFDEDGNYPEDKVLEVGDFKIGMLHGHQVVPSGSKERLAVLARQMDVDILVTGHTHEFKADCIEGRLLINPGSATGAFNSLHEEVVPSFVLMDITGKQATLYVYEMKGSEMAVTKIEHPDRSSDS